MVCFERLPYIDNQAAKSVDSLGLTAEYPATDLHVIE